MLQAPPAPPPVPVSLAELEARMAAMAPSSSTF
jgi:hypothetical protein